MKRPYKLILASLLCAMPLGALLPGCGGGGGGSKSFRLETRLGILFDENNRGNLTFQTEDTASATRSIVGTLQILNSTSSTAAPTPTATTAAGTPTPTPTTPNVIDFLPSPATYIIKGNVAVSGDTTVLNAQGKLDSGLAFTLRGTIAVGSKIRLEANFREGTKVIEGTLLANQIGGGSTATATPTVTGTPTTTGTPGITGTPTATTTATATPSPTGTATPTPRPTITP